MRRLHQAIVVFLVLLSICVFPGSAVVVPGITLTANPGSVVPGGTLTYTITATNSGDEASSSVINFGYGPNLDYVSGSPPSNQELQGFPVSNPAFWFTTETPPRIIQINPGGSYGITVITRVKVDAPCGLSSVVKSNATMIDQGDDNPVTRAFVEISTPVSCPTSAPEFPSPVIPVTMLGLLTVGILIIRSRAK
jgi:hypothetical protein